MALEFLLQKFVFKGPVIFPAKFHDSVPETCAWTALKITTGGKKNIHVGSLLQKREISHKECTHWHSSEHLAPIISVTTKIKKIHFFCASCCPDTPEYKLQMKWSSCNCCILVTLEGRLFWDIMWKCFVTSTHFIYMKEIIFRMFKKLQLSWELLPFIV